MRYFRLFFLSCLLVPTAFGQSTFEAAFLRLSSTLLKSQILDPQDPDYGGLRSPSRNPQQQPVHSRAGEAVYPFAVAYLHTQESSYLKAARLLGLWLCKIQKPSGAWGEEWPRHDGWEGTTADQLISLAGAYELLAEHLPHKERKIWRAAINAAAGFVHKRFPMGNINYQPTGAVALLLAAQVLPEHKTQWLNKADDLIKITLKKVGPDDLLRGENKGVDPGYNFAQSIGFLALYAKIQQDEQLMQEVVAMARAHLPFIYPGGSLDNSWGSRSYKWVLESGTKTAPGLYLATRILGAYLPAMKDLEQKSLQLLMAYSQGGWLGHGPRAHARPSIQPPSNYLSFARAQSLAMGLVYSAPPATLMIDTQLPAASFPWIYKLPELKTVVIRTEALMATVSAYAPKGAKGSGQKGGSITKLWMSGYTAPGIVQISTPADYIRVEAKHMPIEPDIKDLTPRIEAWARGQRFSSSYENNAKIDSLSTAEGYTVLSSGKLRNHKGKALDFQYEWLHRFDDHRVVKTLSIYNPKGFAFRIIEPVVAEPKALVKQDDSTVTIQPGQGKALVWQLHDSSEPVVIHAADRTHYWAPFPGLAAQPIQVSCQESGCDDLKIRYQIALSGAD